MGVLVVACIAPMWLLAVLVTYALERHSRLDQANDALHAARLLMQAVDADIASAFSALHTLAASPLIDDRDWKRMHAQMGELRSQQSALNVFVLAPDLQTQVSLDRPFDAPQARLPFDRLPQVFAKGQPQISDRFIGAVAVEPLLSLGVPVRRDGRVVARVEMVMRPARFDAVLGRVPMPDGFAACLLDGKRQVIAPSTAAGGGASRACTDEGPKGVSLVSDWQVVLQAAPRRDGAHMLWAQTPLALGALCLLGGGWLWAHRLARRVAQPIQALVAPALAIGQGRSATIEPGDLHETQELAHALRSAQQLLEQGAQARDAAQAQQRESQARLALSLEAGGVGDWEFDPASRQFLHSPRHDQCYGHATAMPLLGLDDFDRQVHPEDLQAVRRGREQAIRGQGAWRDEYRIVRPDGAIRWLSVRARWVVGAGSGGCLFGVVADVTERHVAVDLELRRSELEMQNRQMQSLLEQRSRFFASMSHELRTPLNAVINLSELLLRSPPDLQTQRRHLQLIAGAGRDLLALVNDLLDLGQAEAGKMSLQPAWFELEPFCREVIELLAPVAQRRGVRLEMSLEPPRQCVHLDPLRVRQILYNFLSNAVKFSPPDDVVSLRVRAGGQGQVRFEVEDHGPGISALDQDRLFRPYQQLASGQALGNAGTGLGLALAREIAELHGGTVGVRSEPGRGSVFFAVLPREVRAAAMMD